MHQPSNSRFLISSETYYQVSNSNQQNVDLSNKKKISTPALLFCKSGQKDRSINSTQKYLKENQNSTRLISNNRSPLRVQHQNCNLELTYISQKNKSSSPLIKNNSCLFFTDNQTSQLNSDLCLLNSKNSRISRKSIKESLNFCENHNNKIATYTSSSQNDQTFYYCEKCAILLASRGFVINKIQDVSRDLFGSRKSLLKDSKLSINQSSNYINQSKKSQKELAINSRQNEVYNFLQEAKNLIFKIQNKKKQVKENLIQSQEFYGEQIQQVNEYFQLLYQTLELEKNKCYNYILNQRKQVQQPIRLINSTIQQLKNKINSIVNDIQENIQTVFSAEQNVYRLVIEQYVDNYKQVQNKICNLKMIPIQMRKINFEGVPQSIFQLSNLLKESIQNNGLMQNSVKMHQQLNSLRQSMKQSISAIQPKNLFGKNCKKEFCFSFQGQSLKAAIAQKKQLEEDLQQNTNYYEQQQSDN